MSEQASLDELPLSELLRALRKVADLSPTEIEQMTGLKRATIYYIESGRTQKPSAKTLRNIASALSIKNLSKRDATIEELEHFYFHLLMNAAGYTDSRFEKSSSTGIKRPPSDFDIEFRLWKIDFDLLSQDIQKKRIELNNLVSQLDVNFVIEQAYASDTGKSAYLEQIYEVVLSLREHALKTMALKDRQARAIAKMQDTILDHEKDWPEEKKTLKRLPDGSVVRSTDLRPNHGEANAC